jgi:hypothetical protein
MPSERPKNWNFTTNPNEALASYIIFGCVFSDLINITGVRKEGSRTIFVDFTTFTRTTQESSDIWHNARSWMGDSKRTLIGDAKIYTLMWCRPDDFNVFDISMLEHTNFDSYNEWGVSCQAVQRMLNI